MVDIKQNLHFMYWLMVSIEGLLTAASTHCDYGRLKNYYLKHIREERDHPVWMRADLEGLGVTLTQDFRAAAIAGSQYYLIYHNHPALLLGYLHVLEAWPKPADVLDKLEATYGPLKCLRHHVENDPAHVVAIKAEIAALPEHLQAAIQLNEDWVATWLNMVFNTMDKETSLP